MHVSVVGVALLCASLTCEPSEKGKMNEFLEGFVAFRRDTQMHCSSQASNQGTASIGRASRVRRTHAVDGNSRAKAGPAMHEDFLRGVANMRASMGCQE